LTDIDALAVRAKAEFGTFDLLFVNAGFSLFAPLEQHDRGDLRRDVQPERQGTVFRGPETFAADHSGGSIVLTTSTANVKGMPMLAAYGGAKAALRSFARMFAAELLPRGIRVNAVSPGPTDTPIAGKAFPDKDMAAHLIAQMTEAIPMKRFGTAEELAKAVLFLAFDATFTTGVELPVDGGWSQL
jgi:NAD(P)-dependent dehydrogenase (short-subunit alcohol dehydrogenase family)